MNRTASVRAIGLGLVSLLTLPTSLRAQVVGDSAPASVRTRLDVASVGGDGPVRVDGFPIARGRTADLELERFRITSSKTRIVVGRLGGADEPLGFDADRVVLLRGRVAGEGASHVFLAVSEFGCRGTVDLGPGLEAWTISSDALGAAPEGSVDLVVAPRRAGASPAVPFCGVGDAPPGWAVPPADPQTPADGDPIRGLQQIQLAVETDYEFFEQIGGDLDAAAAYVVTMYGAISDIYIRDVNTRMDLTFVRLWDTPEDLFNEADPLNPFREYWNENMDDVVRDTAQFCSGRRDLWAGGVAWVEAICNDHAYSWVGYITGWEDTLAGPVPSDYDVSVAAHELGHNCGVFHNHDYGLDTCDDPATPPRRGGIMSYCGQTYSGGKGNTDMRFETLLQGLMKAYINSRNCVADDCNGNGLRDSADIQAGRSEDVNGNGEPDECEDCNGNGTLDSVDIGGGASQDVNGNGVPDECEGDCNGNGVPDTMDIAEGTSQDVYLDGVPDECQTDCDADGTMDYNEIQADMTLDVDRNAALDACQDCDGDGVLDMTALGNSRNVWIASLAEANLREFYASTGVLTRVSEVEAGTGQDVVITPAGRIFVSDFDGDRIAEFDGSGAFKGDFVGPQGAGLSGPTGLMLTPISLIVSSSGTDSLIEFRLADGGFVRNVVASGAGGLDGPFGLARGAAGTLAVTSDDNRVLEFDFFNGQYLRDLVAEGAGGLAAPKGLVYKPDGNLLVVSHENRSVLEYDGSTGAFIKKWNRGGTEDRLVLEEPWGIRIGPDGDVYVSTSHVHRKDPEFLHLTKARIFQFDIRNGNMIRAYVEGDDTNLYRPTGFDFYPASPDDCNANNRPDSCDIASGISLDCNGNGRPDTCDLADGSSEDADGDGVPDECECYANCDGQGGLDLFDYLCFQNAFIAEEPYADCDHSGGLDLFDFLCFQNAYVAGCG